MLNRFGTTTHPELEFISIINSRLPVDALEEWIFPETEEDKQLFGFEVDANYLIPALEMYELRCKLHAVN